VERHVPGFNGVVQACSPVDHAPPKGDWQCTGSGREATIGAVSMDFKA
jgi:hypothetical protein